ncbi:MAG: hypothetical protein HUU37_06885, partial [Bdellovibrionales bacterium]|nr:hypothetical protein [Bdellovibrionales bacterium]
MRHTKVFLAVAAALWVPAAGADYDADAYFKTGERYHKQRQHFQAARYYFQALQRSSDRGQKNALYANISNSLVSQGMYQSAAYFFLKAIESHDDRAIRIALNGIQPLFENVGGELFRKYLVKYTREYQYSTEQRDYYYYQVAHDDFLKNRPERVIRAVDAVNRSFPSYPSALFLRGTSNLVLGRVNQGVDDFRLCYDLMGQSRYRAPFQKDEAKEMRNRCAAGVARAYYQGRNYEEADRWYDRVEMDSFVWPQIQYERAWAHVARGDYNRALGRLVTYKSPGLSWFHESEVEMLR